MKEKAFSPIFNVTNDAELEALAKAYIQAAHKRQFTMTQAAQTITQLWKEELTSKKNSIVLALPEETAEQRVFREKTERFINKFPEFVQPYGGPLSIVDIKSNTRYTVEIICSFYKTFQEEDYINSSILVQSVNKFLNQISDSPEYSNLGKVKSFKDYIFMKLEYLAFAVTGSSGIGCLCLTDLSSSPFISDKKGRVNERSRTIKWLYEPYEKMLQYDTRRNVTLTKLVQLIWVIETFF